MTTSGALPYAEQLLQWYTDHARDLPWRAPGVGAWPVLVSEVMLQQTPVARVLPVWQEWLHRWPEPAALAAASTGDAVAAWGRLGYPRRALRLHAAATAITHNHGGQVPSDLTALRALPGVGEYTAAAVAAFAFAVRTPVLDTNVNRVLGRVLDGTDLPPAHLTVARRARAEALLPPDGAQAAGLSVALMELGALVCTARSPRCEQCPLRESCRFLQAGRPQASRPRRAQPWHGTDRQCRGRLLQAARETHPTPVATSDLLELWPDADQARRCLDWLVDDRLLSRDGGMVSLPE